MEGEYFSLSVSFRFRHPFLGKERQFFECGGKLGMVVGVAVISVLSMRGWNEMERGIY